MTHKLGMTLLAVLLGSQASAAAEVTADTLATQCAALTGFRIAGSTLDIQKGCTPSRHQHHTGLL